MNSRITEIKNHLLMVEAVSNLPEEIRKEIVVVCTGERQGQYYESVLQKIKDYAMEETFVFVGWVQTYEILTISDFLFLPSKVEGFALSCVEAFLMNVPVARTKTCGWENMKNYCIPISSEDPRQIEDIITYLVENGKKIFNSLTDIAHQYASENFTIQKMTEKTLDVYRSVMKK